MVLQSNQQSSKSNSLTAETTRHPVLVNDTVDDKENSVETSITVCFCYHYFVTKIILSLLYVVHCKIMPLMTEKIL